MTTYTDDPLTADDIREMYYERAAIHEHMAGMDREQAELEARQWLYAYWSSHNEQMDGWGWDDVQRVIRDA